MSSKHASKPFFPNKFFSLKGLILIFPNSFFYTILSHHNFHAFSDLILVVSKNLSLNNAISFSRRVVYKASGPYKVHKILFNEPYVSLVFYVNIDVFVHISSISKLFLVRRQKRDCIVTVHDLSLSYS